MEREQSQLQSARKLYFRPYIEALILCAVTFIIDRQILSAPIFDDQGFKLYSFPILLITAQYGTFPGICAAIFSTIFLYTGNMPRAYPSDDFYSYWWRVGMTPLPWYIAATVVGEIVMRHRRAKSRLQGELNEALKREKLFLNAFTELEQMKDQRERELASVTGSPAQVFKIVASANPKTQDSVFRATLALVQMLINPRKYSLYLMRGSNLRLVRSKGWTETDTFNEQFSLEDSLAREIITNRKELSIATARERSILGQQGIIAVPVIDPKTQKPFGMIKIEDIDWSQVTSTHRAMLSLISQWTGGMLLYTQQVKVAYLMPSSQKEEEEPHKPIKKQGASS